MACWGRLRGIMVVHQYATVHTSCVSTFSLLEVSYNSSSKRLQEAIISAFCVIESIPSMFSGTRVMLCAFVCLGQVALYAATELEQNVRGVCLLNCVGGMNQKGIYQDDWTVAAARPMFALVEWLLKRRRIAAWMFDKFRYPSQAACMPCTCCQPAL